MFYLMISTYAIFSNIKLTKIERSASFGTPGIYFLQENKELHHKMGYCKRGNIRGTLIFADFAVFQQARIQKPAKIFAIFCIHILDT